MGRVGSPQKAVELLLTEDEKDAERLAKMLDTENRNRQKIESRILEEAILKVERDVNFKYNRVIVLASENWHPGVIGIVAGRLKERLGRPAIVIAIGEDGIGKGSGRSIPGLDLGKLEDEEEKKAQEQVLDAAQRMEKLAKGNARPF